MKRFNSLLALIFIVLLPLQGLAASKSTLCQQALSGSQLTQASHADGHHCQQSTTQHHADHQKEKNHCVSACGQLGMAAVINQVFAQLDKLVALYQAGLSKRYSSIFLSKFQRPPIQVF